MKINYILASIFLLFISLVVIADIKDIELIGCTELNGSGCVCHTLERDTTVFVWVEGPDSLVIGETGYYRMYMAGGPAEAGGYNVAGRFGEMVLVDTHSVQHYLSMNELTQAFSLPFPNPKDTIYWDFGYTASDSSADWDTIYSCGISLVWDTIPDSLDRWNFGPKFPVRILENVAVVGNDDELISDFYLYQNYPNPFNPSTSIDFYLPESGKINISVFDVNGNELVKLAEGNFQQGRHTLHFSAEKFSSGVYFYSLTTSKNYIVKKMLLLK
jgi:hypothetical protein